MPDDRTEQERLDDCLSGEHTYDPERAERETSPWMRDWIKEHYGTPVKPPAERPAK